MNHFPVFLAMEGTRVLLSGGGDAALAKLRLLMRTPARLEVFARDPAPEIEGWAAEGRIVLHRRALTGVDTQGATLVYAADEDAAQDARTAALGRKAGALVNVVDNLEASAFLTPAIVDRDPVTVAIGTEGAAPVLARAMKADLEARLPTRLGALARIGKAFRARADALPKGRARRDFWSDYHFRDGPRALDAGGEDAARTALDTLLATHLDRQARPGHVAFVGAGPGDPELLTLKARRRLDEADVVIHDRLVPPAILELARREAVILEAGKTGFGRSMPQSEISALLVEHAAQGAQVVRLKGGDPAVFGRLDEEMEACEAAGIGWHVVPGITAASAAAASLGQSLTRRGRNSSARLMTGQDAEGLAEQDWRALARAGEVAAIYMGKRAARFIQGRLLMHGADPATPMSVVEHASRPEERVLATTLGALPSTVARAALDGPALLMLGLSPRAVPPAARAIPEQEAAI